MRVVICGGAGFIGSNLCDFLARRRGIDDIVVLDDLSSGDADAVIATGSRLVVGSHLDEDLVRSLVAHADTVVNLVDVAEGPWVGGDPVTTERTIAGGMRCVATAAATSGAHLIATSTSTVYGADPSRPAHEELEVLPLTPHSKAFALAEQVALDVTADRGCGALVLRLFDTFGRQRPPGHPSGRLIHDCIDAALNGDDYLVRGDGHDRHEVTSVDFVVRAIAHAITWRTSATGPVNCATGRRASPLEVLATVEAVSGERISARHVPWHGFPIHIASTRRFVRTIGPMEIPSLTSEVESTWEWARRQDHALVTLR